MKVKSDVFTAQMTRKELLIAIPLGLIGVVIAMGLILGPFTWASSALHFSKLKDFKENGIKTTGTIVKIHEPALLNYYGAYYADVEYYNQDSNLVRAKYVWISDIDFTDIKRWQEEEIYYKSNSIYEVILTRSYRIENIAATSRPLYAKWLTIISYSLLLMVIIIIIYFKRKYNPYRHPKPKPYVKPKDSINVYQPRRKR